MIIDDVPLMHLLVVLVSLEDCEVIKECNLQSEEGMDRKSFLKCKVGKTEGEECNSFIKRKSSTVKNEFIYFQVRATLARKTKQYDNFYGEYLL